MPDQIETILMSRKDIEQDARISALEADKGKLSTDSIKPIATVFAILWGLGTSALVLYVGSEVAPLLNREDAAAKYATKAELADLRSRVSGVASSTTAAELRADINSLDRDVAEIPAVIARVEALEGSTDQALSALVLLRDELSQLRTALAQQLDRAALDDVLQQLRDAILAVEAQLNRRLTLEVKEPIYRELDAIRNLIDSGKSETEDNENKIEEIAAAVASLESLLAGLDESTPN